MKRTITYITLIITLTSLGIIGYINRPFDKPSENILNKTFYSYNYTNGEYEIIIIHEKDLDYTGKTLDINNCNTFKYDKNTNTIDLDCNKTLELTEEKDTLILNKTHYFHTTKEEAYNYTFQKHFNLSQESYSIIASNKLNTLEIDYNKYIELKNLNQTSYILLKGNNCKTKCDIITNNIEEIIKNDQIHYLNIDNLTKEQIQSLRINETPLHIETPNLDYFILHILENGNLKSEIELNINGFNFSEYTNLLERNNQNE